MTGFIVFAHGSRIESANQAVRDIAARMAAARGDVVEAAFLELGEPDLAGATAKLVASGVSGIIVIPYFLTLGTHMQRDLPRLVEDAAGRNGNLDIHVASPLDGPPALLEALRDRAKDALAQSQDRS